MEWSRLKAKLTRESRSAARVVYLPYGHVDILGQHKTLAETLKFVGAN
jgi:hypothetical protein